MKTTEWVEREGMVRWVALTVANSLLLTGCATGGITQVSSEPSGAAVYQLRGGHIAYYVGTTPAQWSESGMSPFASPVPNMVAYVVLLPIFLPAALASWIADSVESLHRPRGKRTYAALYHGQFFTPATVSEREVHFNFSTTAGEPVSHGIIRDLRGRFVVGCDPVYIQKELGEPRVKTALPSGEERWDYGDFEVIIGRTPSGRLGFHNVRPTDEKSVSR